MPIYNFDFNRSISRINMSAERSGIFTPGLTSIELHEDQLARFNKIVQRFAPEQPPFTLDQLAGAARRVLRAAYKGEDSAFIKVRMRRAGELRAAFRDTQWDMAPALLKDVRDLLAYLDADTGLIANDAPVVGQLDDAILVDVAMDKLRSELDEYADFCRFRLAEAASQGVDVANLTTNRQHWFEERVRENRLEQQLRRVRSTRYAKEEGAPRFRVC